MTRKWIKADGSVSITIQEPSLEFRNQWGTQEHGRWNTQRWLVRRKTITANSTMTDELFASEHEDQACRFYEHWKPDGDWQEIKSRARKKQTMPEWGRKLPLQSVDEAKHVNAPRLISSEIITERNEQQIQIQVQLVYEGDYPPQLACGQVLRNFKIDNYGQSNQSVVLKQAVVISSSASSPITGSNGSNAGQWIYVIQTSDHSVAMPTAAINQIRRKHKQPEVTPEDGTPKRQIDLE